MPRNTGKQLADINARFAVAFAAVPVDDGSHSTNATGNGISLLSSVVAAAAPLRLLHEKPVARDADAPEMPINPVAVMDEEEALEVLNGTNAMNVNFTNVSPRSLVKESTLRTYDYTVSKWDVFVRTKSRPADARIWVDSEANVTENGLENMSMILDFLCASPGMSHQVFGKVINWMQLDLAQQAWAANPSHDRTYLKDFVRNMENGKGKKLLQNLQKVFKVRRINDAVSGEAQIRDVLGELEVDLNPKQILDTVRDCLSPSKFQSHPMVALQTIVETRYTHVTAGRMQDIR
ncbi:MAG: hypothetical protein ACREBR_02300 [bacterium]